MAERTSRAGMTYAQAGVDRVAEKDALSKIWAHAKETCDLDGRGEVVESVGPFCALFALPNLKGQFLVASVDGVGTKSKLAALMDRYESIGQDLVSLSVNDILTNGATPVFFLDYLGGSNLSVQQKDRIVKGIKLGCKEVGCALIGGETADMPGVYCGDDFDLVGFIVGVVDRENVIDGSRIAQGDALLGIASAGLHTNGYSLARAVFGIGVGEDPEGDLAALERTHPSLGVTLGEALVAPHRCYYEEVERLRPLPKGIAHITGGGLIENVPRILRPGLTACFDKSSWTVPPIFRWIQEEGNIDEEEMFHVFNMGLGLVLACSAADVSKVQALVPEVMVVGEIVRESNGQRVIIS